MLPICRDFKSHRCLRPQCKYVHLSEGNPHSPISNSFISLSMDLDFVEVKNGYVSICKEAILGNCSNNECKFIIFVLKNFNGKFFLLLTIKLGIQTSILFREKLLHINHFLFFFFSSKPNRTLIGLVCLIKSFF